MLPFKPKLSDSRLLLDDAYSHLLAGEFILVLSDLNKLVFLYADYTGLLFKKVLNEEGPQEILILDCVKPGSKTRISQCPAKFNWLNPITLYGTAGHFL